MLESRISADARIEETGRRVDGGSGSMRPQVRLRLKDQCFLGAYVQGVVTFGAPILQRNLYRLCVGLLTTGLI